MKSGKENYRLSIQNFRTRQVVMAVFYDGIKPISRQIGYLRLAECNKDYDLPVKNSDREEIEKYFKTKSAKSKRHLIKIAKRLYYYHR